MKPLLFVLSSMVALSMCGCDPFPVQSTSATSNDKTPVDLLFEIDGTKVYRFEDDGRYIYFTIPSHGATTSWYQSDGKTSHLVTVSQ